MIFQFCLQTDKQTDKQTDRQNDSVVYRVAPQLKTDTIVILNEYLRQFRQSNNKGKNDTWL